MTVAWADFYKTARWQRLRKLQLTRHPLCKFCLERGIVTAANVGRTGGTGPHSASASCRACTSRATSRRSGRSSCAATAATSVSTAGRFLITRLTVRAEMAMGMIGTRIDGQVLRRTRLTADSGQIDT
jgi:hypothetical protein